MTCIYADEIICISAVRDELPELSSRLITDELMGRAQLEIDELIARAQLVTDEVIRRAQLAD